MGTRERQIIKLLIAARIDVGGVKVSQPKIDRFLQQHGFVGYISTSAKRGDGCSDQASQPQPCPLKQLIAKHIPWDSLPWTSTPKMLATLKNELLKLTEQQNSRLLRFDELRQHLERRLAPQPFDANDVRTAVTLLANHGLLIPLQFGDLVLLRPELLNGYAAAIIRAAREHSDEIGCVSTQAVLECHIDLAGVDRLEAGDEKLLMPALLQIFLDKSLCIAENTEAGHHLIFPSQYRREREIPQHPDIYVSYHFTGEWQTVYTTLVVRLWYSKAFEKHELWRNAAEFTTSKGQLAGVIMDELHEGQANISLFFAPDVADELKIILIEYVHQHLEKYAREVHRNRHYVCSCGKAVSDFEAVQQRLAAKKSFIFCQYCDTQVELIDFIEQRLKTDPIAAKILQMEQTASHTLDNQSREQTLNGHMMAICGQANQIFRLTSNFDYGIDGEIEFKDNEGQASGKKIYVQLKHGSSFLRQRKKDGAVIFDVKNSRHLDYWVDQPVDVYLVIEDEQAVIRWMNISDYLRTRSDKTSKQIHFAGEKLDLGAVWRLRDRFFSAQG